MKKGKNKKIVSIPIVLPIAIITGIILIVCYGGTHLISNSAKYQTANASTTDLNDFEYKKLEDGSYEITKYTGSDESIVIPSANEYRVPITSIGEGAFSGKKGIKSVQISQGITNIGKKAFFNCSNLVSISIPNLVTKIGDYAFSGTNITRVRLPESVTSIGRYAFQNCYNLYEINIPKGITTINSSTFQSCAFESIEIPDGVTSIGSSAFMGCINLSNIELPEKLEDIYSYAFNNCDALTCVVIPNGVKFIDTWAFYGCDNLSTLIIPDSVTRFCTADGGPIFNNGTIYCKKGSSAEEYAKSYGNSYKITYITDNELPKINSVTVNPCEWTNEDVVITVDAEDSKVGLYRKAYSFDGGKTWQEENTKTYTENINGIIIAVKDNLANQTTYEKIIDITNIDKEKPTIFGVTKSTEELIKGAVTLTIDAADDISDFEDLLYSFDGGMTWQSSNSKKYTYRISGLEIQVKDKAGNIAIYEDEINITNIIELKELKVVKPPNKTEYYARENFDSTGMVVTAVYDNGDEEATTDYTIEGEKNMLCTQTLVVLRSNNNSYISAEIPITMKHIYKETVVDPTCTEQGYTTKKCEECKTPTIKENYVDALGHSYTNYVSNEDATCLQDGTKTAKCDRCTVTDTISDVGSAKGHSEVVDAAIAATCTETGLTEGKHCSECQNVLLKQEVVSALGHNYDNMKCIKCGKEAPKISVTAENYEIIEEYITKIPSKITVKDFKEKIIITNTTDIKLFNKKEEELEDDDIIGTGATMVLKSEFETKMFKLVVAGDATGDGTVDFKDIVAINRHRLKQKLLEGAYLIAGEVTGDEVVDFKDIVKINRFRLNRITQLF